MSDIIADLTRHQIAYVIENIIKYESITTGINNDVTSVFTNEILVNRAITDALKEILILEAARSKDFKDRMQAIIKSYTVSEPVFASETEILIITIASLSFIKFICKCIFDNIKHKRESETPSFMLKKNANGEIYITSRYYSDKSEEIKIINNVLKNKNDSNKISNELKNLIELIEKNNT